MDPLTPDRWRRIERILDRAFELEPDARSRFLDRACAGDASLRTVVELLLVADRDAGEFLEVPIGARADALVRESSALQPVSSAPGIGDRIGPWRLIRELGRGGMGTVFLAERVDGQFRQRAALKLIRGGIPGDDARRRFLRERQILAGLQHAGIARLLDGGVTPDGWPWFAMEYIEGLPITRYCDERRLGIEDRLQLFRRVCRAVQHAHENRVVHRDLKPANILVTSAGDPKLLDFGIARLLLDPSGEETATLTLTGVSILTPEYAAPEQVRGEATTVASDVYALGVVLYELLSGHRPYRLARRDPVHVERIICEHEPPRPSTMVTRTGERQHGDGTVDTLTPEAISAARDTQPGRLRRRLAGDLDHIVLRAIAKEPARRYASAAALDEDLTRCLEGRPVLARRGRTVYRAGRFTKRHRAGLALGVSAVLVLGALAALLLARSTRSANSTALPLPPASATTTSIEAWTLYQEGLRTWHRQDAYGARRLFRAALDRDSMFALAVYRTITTEWQLGIPQDSALQARLLRMADRLPDRERLILRGRIAWSTADPALTALADTLTTRYPDEPEGWFLVGRGLVMSGQLLQALPHLRRVVDMDSLGLHGGSADCRACEAFTTIIHAYIQADSLSAAERTAREWVRIQPQSGQAWHTLALVLELQGRRAGSLSAIRRAGALKPGNPYVPIYPALLDIRSGAFEPADRLLREQIRAGPPDTRVEALWFLAISLRYQGRLREALAAARQLRQLRPDAPESRVATAQVLFEAGRYLEAAALFDSLAAEPARADLDRVPSAVARARSWNLAHAATALAAAGDTSRLGILADTIRVLGAQTVLGQRQRLHHHVRGLLLDAHGRTEDAVRAFYDATFWPVAPGSGFTRTNLELGAALLDLGRAEEAVRILQPPLRLSLEAAAFYATQTELHALLGRAFEAAGQPDSARTHFAWVLEAWKDADPEFHGRRDDVRRRLRALGS